MTVLAAEVLPGDVIEPLGIKVKSVVPNPENLNETLLLGHNGRYLCESNRLALMVIREFSDWDDLTPEHMRRLSSEFAPGYQLDEEFVKPLWLNAASAIELSYEDNDEEPNHEEMTRLLYVQVESAIHVLLYGSTPDGTWQVVG